MSSSPSRVLVIYNTDYDAELIAETGADVSAVEEAARSVREGIEAAGFETEIVGVQGPDLGRVMGFVEEWKPDLVFNLCESMSGDVRNEVVLPSVLDMMKVPYTGPGPLTIVMCLHKERTKEVLSARGVNTPEYALLATPSDLSDPKLDDLPYPMFLKLVHEDASVGIEASNRCETRDALEARTRELWAKYKQPVLAERFIPGREVNVTVMGNGASLEVLPLHEIDFEKMPGNRPKIVSYAAKWDENHVDYEGTKPVPMKNLTPELEARIIETACSAFSALELCDFGRVDLRIDSEGTPWVIDINPNCDLSPDAGVARSAAAGGMSYPELVGRICRTAWSRYEHSESKTPTND